MLEARFEEVFENAVHVKNVLILRYNGKYVNSLDYPTNVYMTQDEVDLYIAGKLSGLLY